MQKSIVYGTQFSPFVKKVVATLKLKGVEYTVEHVNPKQPTQKFAEISHLGKIPAFEDDQVTLYDSSVICDYLEQRYPENSLYPTDIISRAKVLQFEEYADTKLFELLGAGIVYERFVKPYFLQEKPDEQICNDILNNLLPIELKYLNDNIKATFLLSDDLTIADITIGAIFLASSYAGYTVNKDDFPQVASYINNIWSTNVFKEIAQEDKARMEALLKASRQVS